jgi:hypothetical protein
MANQSKLDMAGSFCPALRRRLDALNAGAPVVTGCLRGYRL